MWTRFEDNFTGGKQKTNWREIYVELPSRDATEYFRNRFEIDPYEVSCDCIFCGEDFDLWEVKSLPTDRSKNALVIPIDEIKKNG